MEFENDVKMYGTETYTHIYCTWAWFENDVKMYGTETRAGVTKQAVCLRMM